MQREGVHPRGDCPHQVWEDDRQGRGQKDITIAKNKPRGTESSKLLICVWKLK